MLADLRYGIIPMDDTEVEAFDIWDWYKGQKPFKFVCFEQFNHQLTEHRKQVKADNDAVAVAAAAFDHDTKLRQPATHNHNGRPLFYLSAAKGPLIDDVFNGRHVGLDPDTFRRSRPEYMEWALHEFRPQIYQAARLRRWYNYREKQRRDKEAADEKRWEKAKAEHEKKAAHAEKTAGQARRKWAPKTST
jgi:hypothetical protein